MITKINVRNHPCNMGLGTEDDIPSLKRSLYQLWNKCNELEKELKSIRSSTNIVSLIRELPYGWKIECTPTTLEITQNDVSKGFILS